LRNRREVRKWGLREEMDLVRAMADNCIGIYVRISRDDNGENYETVENQRELLLDYVSKKKLGKVVAIYTDDNVSGSGFERIGLERLKDDVLAGRIQILLLKDLSRLGRNNAKTLQWIDFLEEHGIRILTADGRYDSLQDNDMVGIETWANERYIRDISRKIRSCLRFKIERGEYLGNAPYGYVKSNVEKNRLVINEEQAEVVRQIYDLYLSGLGYSSIAGKLNERGIPSPEGMKWNRISIRRILTSRVYIGDTVQGVSERISFKSKKTRRLPEEEWVITENTHEGIITREEFQRVQKIRESRAAGKTIRRRKASHILSGVIFCGRCGSTMYVRKRSGGLAYVCGNYCRNGSGACSSHFVYEAPIVSCICSEVMKLFGADGCKCESEKLSEWLAEFKISAIIGDRNRVILQNMLRQLETARRQHEMIYRDRLDGRISEQLFDRMNRQYEAKIRLLESETERLHISECDDAGVLEVVEQALERVGKGHITNELVRIVVDKIAVYEPENCRDCGSVVIDLRFNIGL